MNSILRFRSCDVFQVYRYQYTVNHHRLYICTTFHTLKQLRLVAFVSVVIKKMSYVRFCFVLDENRVMCVPFNTTSAVRQPAYRPTMISKSDGSRRNFDDDDLQICVTVSRLLLKRQAVITWQCPSWLQPAMAP